MWGPNPSTNDMLATIQLLFSQFYQFRCLDEAIISLSFLIDTLETKSTDDLLSQHSEKIEVTP